MRGLSPNYNSQDFFSPGKTSHITDAATNNSIQKFTTFSSVNLQQSHYDGIPNLLQSQIKILDGQLNSPRVDRNPVPQITQKDIEDLIAIRKAFLYQYQRHDIYKKAKQKHYQRLKTISYDVQNRKNNVQLQKDFYKNCLAKQYKKIKNQTKYLKLKQESRAKASIKAMKKQIEKLIDFIEQEKFNKTLEKKLQIQPHYHFHNVNYAALPNMKDEHRNQNQFYSHTYPYPKNSHAYQGNYQGNHQGNYQGNQQQQYQQQPHHLLVSAFQNLSAGVGSNTNSMANSAADNSKPQPRQQYNLNVPPLNFANNLADYFQKNKEKKDENLCYKQDVQQQYNDSQRKNSNLNNQGQIKQKSVSSSNLLRKSSSRSLLKTAEKVDIFNLSPRKTEKKSSRSWQVDGQQNDVLELLQNSQKQINSGIQHSASRLNYPNSKIITDNDNKQKIEQVSQLRKSQGNIKSSVKKSNNSKFTESKILKSSSPKNSNGSFKVESQANITSSVIVNSGNKRINLDPRAERREEQLIQSRININLRSDGYPDGSSSFLGNLSRDSSGGDKSGQKSMEKESRKSHKKNLSQQSMPPLPQRKPHKGPAQNQFRKITEENVSDLKSSKISHDGGASKETSVLLPQKILLSQNNQLHVSQNFLNLQNERKEIVNSQVRIQFESLDDSFEKVKSIKRELQTIKLKKKQNQDNAALEDEYDIVGISLQLESKISRESPKQRKNQNLVKKTQMQSNNEIQSPRDKAQHSNQRSSNSEIFKSAAKQEKNIKHERKSSIERGGQRIPTNEIDQDKQEYDDFYRELSLEPLSKISKLKNSSQVLQQNPQNPTSQMQLEGDFGNMDSQLRSSTSSKIVKKGKQFSNSSIKKTSRNSLQLTKNMQAVAEQQEDDDFDSDLMKKKNVQSYPVIQINYGTQSEQVTKQPNRLSVPFS